MIKQQKLKFIKQHYESSLSTNPTPARRTSLSLKITEAGTDKSDGGKAEDADDEPDRGAARARAPWARPRPRPRPPGLGSDRRLCREEFRRLTGLEITSSDCGGREGGAVTNGDRARPAKIRGDEIILREFRPLSATESGKSATLDPRMAGMRKHVLSRCHFQLLMAGTERRRGGN